MDLFSDIDLSFTPHPLTGDIAVLKDVNSVKTSMKNLIQTAFYERKFKHDIGSNVGKLLFELSSPILKNNLEQSIIQVIENYEPRVVLDSIEVIFQDDDNAILITIYFRIVATLTPQVTSVTLKRTR